MSTQTSNAGNLYLQKKSNKHKSQDIFIRSDFTHTLKPFQICGIRFLFKQYLKGDGAVLNDENSLGKTVQTVLFLSAIHTDTTKQSLILCDESKIYHWLYHFDNWSTINAVLLNADDSAASIVIAPSSSFNVVNDRKWNVIVIDNLEPLSYAKRLQNASSYFKIWLLDKYIKNDIKNLYKLLQWISSNKIGTQKSFESNLNEGKNSTVSELWRKRQFLNILYKKWLLRRTKSDVEDQLSFLDVKNYDTVFEQWLNHYKNSKKSQPNKDNLHSTLSDEEVENSNNDSLGAESSLQSSPSLLDLLFMNDAERSPNKRKIADEQRESKTKKSKSGDIVEKTPDSNMFRNNISNINANSHLVSNMNNFKSTDKPESTNVSLQNVNNEVASINGERFETYACNIKYEEDCSSSTPKFQLLDSLFFSNSQIPNNIKKEFTHNNPPEQQTTSKMLDTQSNVSSKNNSFKLLDRFFS